jgi:hypothetical protein
VYGCLIVSVVFGGRVVRVNGEKKSCNGSKTKYLFGGSGRKIIFIQAEGVVD